MRLSRSGPRRGRPAGATVEFAVILALYMAAFLYGMFELSRGVMVMQVMTNAARAGARQGAQTGSTNTAVTTAVNNVMNSYALMNYEAVAITVSDPNNANNTTDVSTAGSGSKITVQVSMKVKNFSWSKSYFFLKSTATDGSDAKLYSQALTMRKN